MVTQNQNSQVWEITQEVLNLALPLLLKALELSKVLFTSFQPAFNFLKIIIDSSQQSVRFL